MCTIFLLSFQLFLDPLGQAVGSTKSKQLLYQMCSSVHDMNHLLELGCLLGISEWTNVITPKCQLPESAVQILTPDIEDYCETDDHVRISYFVFCSKHIF